MKQSPKFFLITLLSLAVGAAAFTVSSGSAPRTDGVQAVEALQDESLDDYRLRLLDVAHGAASAFPTFPHAKNRARAQEEVVVACLELDQPRRALQYVERIDGWRRGHGFADLGLFCARQGADPDQARHFLRVARAVAERPLEEEDQDWQRDRIRSKMAAAYLLLGDTERAEELSAELEVSEQGHLQVVEASLRGEDAFDEQMEAAERVLAKGELDASRNVLQVCVRLYERFYEDEARRERIESLVDGTRSKLPLMVSIEVTAEFTESALEHGDRDRALALLEQASELMAAVRWNAEYGVPLQARLAALRFRAGQEAAGLAEAEDALELFERDREDLVSGFRAGAVRPLAEAYLAMGDRDTALALYRRTVEEGAVNPNARPRADDLVATCCSMAVHGVEPDDELWERLLELREGLVDPW